MNYRNLLCYSLVAFIGNFSLPAFGASVALKFNGTIQSRSGTSNLYFGGFNSGDSYSVSVLFDTNDAVFTQQSNSSYSYGFLTSRSYMVAESGSLKFSSTIASPLVFCTPSPSLPGCDATFWASAITDGAGGSALRYVSNVVGVGSTGALWPDQKLGTMGIVLADYSQKAFVNGVSPTGLPDLTKFNTRYAFMLSSENSPVTGSLFSVAGTIDSVSFISGVPEPETYTLMLAGLALIGATFKRRKAKQA